MDIWKYFDIGHARHVICNPLNEAKLDEMIELLDLPRDARVLEIACGKGAFLVRAARRWSCRGTGLDLSPFSVRDARRSLEGADLSDAIEILEENGAAHRARPGSVDLAACIGASWIWGGHRGTLEALARWTRPGGLVLVGEPFWLREPTAEHLAASGLRADSWGTHADNFTIGEAQGLLPLHSIASNQDDWDRYQGYQWHAAEHWAARHPDDPDREEVFSRMAQAREAYLRWGRDEIGWALYLFRVPPA